MSKLLSAAHHAAVATLAGSLLAPSAARAVLPEYTILDLGTLGGPKSEAHALNASGQVAGWAKTAAGDNRAFITAPNSLIDPGSSAIPLPGDGTANFAYGINTAGQVAGVAQTSSGDLAFLYSGGKLTPLGTLGGDWSYAYAINDVGHVVGGAAKPPLALTYPTHAFMYDGSLHDLGTLGGIESYAHAINSTGQIVGYSQLQPAPTGYTPVHGFVWTPHTTNGATGTMSDVPTLGGLVSYAWGINDAGQIVGGADTEGDLAYHAFLRTASATPAMIDLGTLGGTSSEANAINNLGMIVGFAETPSASHAFIYADGAMHDLNDLLPSGSGWALTQAKAINDSAQIVGWGTSPSGQTHGYLLTPLPTWAVDADGNWSTAADWLGSVPSGAGVQANFTTAITAPRTVLVDSARTLGRILIDSPNSYTLAGPGTLTLSGAADAVGIEVRSGSHTITAPLEIPTPAPIALSAGATLKLAGPVHGAASGLTLSSGATLDLAGNPLVIDYEAAEPSPMPAVVAAIAAAQSAGWAGAGLTSSLAAADPSHSTGLGYAEASSLGLSSFAGVALDGSDVLVKHTYYGDTNLDGKVDVVDLGNLASTWQTAGSWTAGDSNYDGFVDVIDLGLLASNWQAGVSNPLAPSSLSESLAAYGLPQVSVPEPAMVGVIGAAALFLGRLRAHRSRR